MSAKSLMVGIIVLSAMLFVKDANAVLTTDEGSLSCSPNCNIGDSSIFQGLEINGDFAHVYGFHLETDSNLTFTLTNNNIGINDNLQDLQLFIFDTDPHSGTVTFGPTSITPANDPAFAASAVVSTAGFNPFVQLALLNITGPSDYWVMVVGRVANGAIQGAYTGTLDITAVPLPPAIWLFISALVGLVSFARIRRKGMPA